MRASEIIEKAKKEGRSVLTEVECREILKEYGIPIPEGYLARSEREVREIFAKVGAPAVMKIVSPDVIHKSDVGGVKLNIQSEKDAIIAYNEILENVKKNVPEAKIDGILIQKMIPEGIETIIGGTFTPQFGHALMFGLGGIFVEIMRDVSFNIVPISEEDAREMIEEIKGRAILEGVRGKISVDKDALVNILLAVSSLLKDHPEIVELDLNPVIALEDSAFAVDARMILGEPKFIREREYTREEILEQMRRIFSPKGIAIIGASSDPTKLGYAVLKNLVESEFDGEIYPVNPKGGEILGKKVYTSVEEIDGEVDVAVLVIPAKFIPNEIERLGRKGVVGAVVLASGFAEVGNKELQEELVEKARKHRVRILGPNIFGFYYTPRSLCATFCTPYYEKGGTALICQSGGVGMGIIGYSRSNRMGVSAIVGLGNKSDIDEDDLLEFFGEDENTRVIAMHMEDMKDGRSFIEVATRVSKKKPIVVLKAGATKEGQRAASSHTGALGGDLAIYDAVFKKAGIIRASNLEEMLDIARALNLLPVPKGENVLILTGAGGLGVLLVDACVKHGLKLMRLPDDLDAKFREYIPPFGATGNPVDITGGEPPETYEATLKIALEDDRVHAIIIGYWHTLITPPMAFAQAVIRAKEEAEKKGKRKPMVAVLAGDVEVEEASRYLEERGIPAFPYSSERAVAVMGALYKWARRAGKI
jgi:acetyl coenzyme A synthetase (ADP forming)-like protein